MNFKNPEYEDNNENDVELDFNIKEVDMKQKNATLNESKEKQESKT